MVGSNATMKIYINTQNIRRTKIIMLLFLLLTPLAVGCRENTTNEKPVHISKDPFLLAYLRQYPTIKIDTSENIVIQRIQYKDFDKKETYQGSENPSEFSYTIFLLQDGVFSGIERVFTGTPARRYRGVDITRNQEGFITNIAVDSGSISPPIVNHTYTKNGNVVIANNGLSRGAVAAVLVEEENKFSYWNSYQVYNRRDMPVSVMEFINGEDVIFTMYTANIISSRSHFINGILMKKEFFVGETPRTETYTVSSGIGELIVTKPDGEIIQRSVLERKLNSAGLLEYEGVRLETGEGYAYFFTKDMVQ